jgi:site-specific DNA recombinase
MANTSGLEQEFNSLNAQREAAEAYIASQQHEGWVCVSDRYDDGGFAGATMERPALSRLFEVLETGVIACHRIEYSFDVANALVQLVQSNQLFSNTTM